MFRLNDILVDKEATSFVRVENIPSSDDKNACCRTRILAVDSNTGYPIHLTCACVDLNATTGYSVDLNCKFEPWLDTIEKESEKEKIQEIIDKLKDITWEIPCYDKDEEEDYDEEYEEYNSDNECLNEQGEEEFNNNIYIKTLRNKLHEDSEDDDATLVPSSPKSSLVTLNTNDINNNTTTRISS